MDDRFRWRVVWTSFLAGAAAAEWHALYRNRGPHAPASAYLRWVFHAEHPSRLRRTLGHSAYAALSVWLWRHLFNRKVDQWSERS